MLTPSDLIAFQFSGRLRSAGTAQLARVTRCSAGGVWARFHKTELFQHIVDKHLYKLEYMRPTAAILGQWVHYIIVLFCFGT